jgi:glyoxylase-like metal-dependent hydrolase (beta-lactamase superfamily II)
MTTRIEIIDLEFQGQAGLIASFLIYGPEGHVLVESGPGSTLPAMKAGLERYGLEPGDIDYLFLTHIHFDHGGAAGWWAQQGTKVCVHPIGAPHLIDPTKLINSATRIYGDRMETLWGDILAAPAENVIAVEDGDVITAAGLEFQAIYTPGGTPWLDLPAPPPEFDRELWKKSLDKLRAENLETIYRTHFGPRSNVAREIDEVERLIDGSTDKIHQFQSEGLERDEIITRFREWMVEFAAEDEEQADRLRADEVLNPRHMSVDGILRYWKKRAEREG